MRDLQLHQKYHMFRKTKTKQTAKKKHHQVHFLFCCPILCDKNTRCGIFHQYSTFSLHKERFVKLILWYRCPRANDAQPQSKAQMQVLLLQPAGQPILIAFGERNSLEKSKDFFLRQ